MVHLRTCLPAAIGVGSALRSPLSALGKMLAGVDRAPDTKGRRLVRI
jgi:hypothetical protein